MVHLQLSHDLLLIFADFQDFELFPFTPSFTSIQKLKPPCCSAATLNPLHDLTPRLDTLKKKTMSENLLFSATKYKSPSPKKRKPQRKLVAPDLTP